MSLPPPQPSEILDLLRSNLSLYQDLLRIVGVENEDLRGASPPSLARSHGPKKDLLPRLVQSLDPLTRSRIAWQSMSPSERARFPEIGALVRQNQDLLMKIILLDRENEQALLRHGLVPARELPSVNRQRPHYVADLYRRQPAA